MGTVFTLFTASGPIIGGLGYFLDLPILFWTGVALSAVNLWMNGMSGAMNFPILPLVFIIAAALLLSPWYIGAGAGLLAWTAIEAASGLLPRRSSN